MKTTTFLRCSARDTVRSVLSFVAGTVLLATLAGCQRADTIAARFGQKTAFSNSRVHLLVTIGFLPDATFVRAWYAEDTPVDQILHNDQGRTRGTYTKAGDLLTCSDGTVYQLSADGSQVFLLRVETGSVQADVVAARVLSAPPAGRAAAVKVIDPERTAGRSMAVVPGCVLSDGRQILELTPGTPGTVFNPPLVFTKL